MNWKRKNMVIKESIIDYLEKIINEELDKGYSLTVSIGTDSQNASRGDYKFVTVILIHTFEDIGGITVGRGGIVISSMFHHSFKARNKELVNERMVFEVSKSIEVAYELAPLLDLYEIPLEIHADINPNPNYESNKALQQAIGYILGMGYEFKVKPSAHAASNCADKLC